MQAPEPTASAGGCVPGRTQDTEALVEALWRQDVPAVRAILNRGRVDVNALLSEDDVKRMVLQYNVQFPILGHRQEEDLPGDDEEEINVITTTSVPAHHHDVAPTTVRMSPTPTLLGLAVMTGAPESVAALLDAGARPWPTREALLNEALSHAAVVGYERDGRFLPSSGLRTAALLLRRLGRSPALDPLDPNPLSVARLALVRGMAFAPEAVDSLSDALERTLGSLLAAGYSADERVQGVGVPLAPLDQLLEPTYGHDYELRSQWEGLYGSPAEYDLARAALSRITERESVEADLAAAAETVADPGLVHGRDPLVAYLGVVGRALGRVSNLYDARSPPLPAGALYRQPVAAGRMRSPPALTDGAEGEGEEHAGHGRLPQSLLENLPVEVVEAIASARGLSARDLIALYATSPLLAAAVARPLAERAAVVRAYAEPGAPCGDYAGCLATLVTAIARDDPTAVGNVLDTGVVRVGDLVDPSIAQIYGNPSTDMVAVAGDQRLTSLLPVAFPGRLGGASPNVPTFRYGAESTFGLRRLPRGSPYTTPLGLAASAKSVDTVRALVAAGAQPWPSIEAVLARALDAPLADQVVASSRLLVGPGAAAQRYSNEPRMLREAAAEARARGLTKEEVEGPNPTVSLAVRRASTADVVRALTAAYRRSARLDPDDANPLTVLREQAAATIGPRALELGNGAAEAVRIALEPIIGALLDAGYSPDERGRSCADDMTGRSERALARDVASSDDASAIEALVARAFDGVYATIPRAPAPTVRPSAVAPRIPKRAPRGFVMRPRGL